MTTIVGCIIIGSVFALWCFGMGLRRGEVFGIHIGKKRLLDEICKGSIKHAYSQPEILQQPHVMVVEDLDGFRFEITARFIVRDNLGESTRTNYIIER